MKRRLSHYPSDSLFNRENLELYFIRHLNALTLHTKYFSFFDPFDALRVILSFYRRMKFLRISLYLKL